MKKQSVFTAVLSLFLMIGINNTAEAQFSKKLKAAKSAMKLGKKKTSKGGGSGSFSSFNNETDDLGITGEYFSLNDSKAYGFRFVKESEGKIVNKLHYFEKKGDEPQLKLQLKETYFTKHNVKLFFKWMSASASGYVEVIEVAPGVFAQIKSDRSLNNADLPVALNAKRTVVDIMAKNKADFDTWDIETGQAKVDMILTTLKSANSDKVKKKLLRFDAYKNYKGKIAFAKGTNYLKNSRNNQPTEKVANFITKRELGATVAYKPYFEVPLAQSHPGAWFNVTYEMNGVKTDREVLRKSSTKFSKNIPQYDSEQDKFYWQWSKVLLDTSNNRADYAFLELLRQTQDNLKAGQTYDVKITVWAFKDGENIDQVASSTIQLEYTSGANGTEKLLFDPVKGWVTILEDYLDE